MLNPPLTKEEAEKVRYGQWAGNPDGRAYKPNRCAYRASGVGRSIISRQCGFKPGKGPDGLYCGIHSKKVKV